MEEKNNTIVKNNVKKPSNNSKSIKPQVEMIVAIVTTGYSDLVVDASREAGATGATILRGRSCLKRTKFNKINIISSDKEIILILVDKKIRKNVMKNISDKTHLYENGKGVCFCMPVTEAKGINGFEKEPNYVHKNKK